MPTNKNSRKNGASESLSRIRKPSKKTPEKIAQDVKKTLKEYGLVAKEKIKITNPITGEKSIVELRRDGTPESELIKALADPKSHRTYKDAVLSMYLWNRGSENASFVFDLMRYKGEHTKETRVFKSQMRFDFEMFMDIMVQHLHDSAQRAEEILDIDLVKEMKAYRDWAKSMGKKKKKNSYFHYKYGNDKLTGMHNLVARMYSTLVSDAMYNLAQAERIADSRDRITKARMATKGQGIYVDRFGKAYDINDPELDDIIKSDREATADIEKE